MIVLNPLAYEDWRLQPPPAEADRIYIELQAPFAHWEPWATATGYRRTYPVMPPTAALGLVGALLDRWPTLPTVGIAIGELNRPGRSEVARQSHNCQKPGAGKTTINVSQVESLVDVHLVVGVDLSRTDETGLGDRLRHPVGVRPLYAGSSNHLFDVVQVVDAAPESTRWWEVQQWGDRPSSLRTELPVRIDRTDRHRSQTVAMQPGASGSEPPASAWTWPEVRYV